jgi:hypothetical protein
VSNQTGNPIRDVSLKDKVRIYDPGLANDGPLMSTRRDRSNLFMEQFDWHTDKWKRREERWNTELDLS